MAAAPVTTAVPVAGPGLPQHGAAVVKAAGNGNGNDSALRYVAGAAGLLAALGGGWWFVRRGRGGNNAGPRFVDHSGSNEPYLERSVMQMKLSTKLCLGFVGVLAITVALGGLAVWKMNRAVVRADRLAHEYVPEVDIATRMNDSFGQASLAMRTYGLTGSGEQLAKFPELVRLREDREKAKAVLGEYLSLADATEKQNAVIATAREAMNNDAPALVTALGSLSALQRQRLDSESSPASRRPSCTSVSRRSRSWRTCRTWWASAA